MTVMTSLASRLRAARLYLCTDAREAQGDLEDFLRAAVAGGVDVVQIRQRGMSRDAELAALEVARSVAAASSTIVAVHESARLAEKFAADMLHLGADEGSARRARRRLHEWALVGRSAHSTDQLDEALADDDVSYVSIGPVHATPVEPDVAPVGLDLVRHAARVAPVADVASKPWFAVGGISADTLDDVLAAGARRVVVVRAITEAADPQAAARALKDRLRQAWADDPALASYALRSAALGL
ncbi:thiamine-phosphate pyrophosphorylase [Microlunatus flavus]|uniref:Thiamine-phosphate synthase n=2 Tax=Microlunatus flavus TaxID=1036181 RepID=A0A1H9HIK3_9ACTN|nr:thiamine-phosphate pyrophosphorylase [Microlunatus flavus]